MAGGTFGILLPSHLSNNRYRMVFLLSPRSFGQDLAYMNIKYVVSNLLSFTNLFQIRSKRNKTGEVFDQVLIRFGPDSNFLLAHFLYPLSIFHYPLSPNMYLLFDAVFTLQRKFAKITLRKRLAMLSSLNMQQYYNNGMLAFKIPVVHLTEEGASLL